MEKWYYYRLSRLWIIRNPLKGLFLVGIIAFGLGLSVYSFLEQFDWGRIVVNIFFTILSSEASSLALYNQEKMLWIIISYIIIADTVCIFFDLFIVNKLMAWKFFKYKVDWVSKQLNYVLKWIKNLWLFKRIKSFFSNGIADSINDYINDIKKNPSKAGIGAVAILGAIPRLPFMMVGGVSLAVFFIKYNRLGYRGWIALTIGIITRNSFWLASIYGVSSIF